MPLVAVSVGSNLDREHNIDRALESLRSSFGQLRISRVYETPAVGFSGPDFYNLVVAFETGLNVRPLIDRLHEIEAMCLEDEAVSWITERAEVNEVNISFDDLMNPGQTDR